METRVEDVQRGPSAEHTPVAQNEQPAHPQGQEESSPASTPWGATKIRMVPTTWTKFSGSSRPSGCTPMDCAKN
jgi:hypothetical protein